MCPDTFDLPGLTDTIYSVYEICNTLWFYLQMKVWKSVSFGSRFCCSRTDFWCCRVTFVGDVICERAWSLHINDGEVKS